MHNEGPKVELKPDGVQTAEVVDAKLGLLLEYVNKQVGELTNAIKQGMMASNALREMIKIADFEIETLYKKTGHEKPENMPYDSANVMDALINLIRNATAADVDN